MVMNYSNWDISADFPALESVICDVWASVTIERLPSGVSRRGVNIEYYE